MNPEENAPGWRIICPKCGLDEPLGKYGVRIGARSKGKRLLKRCAECGRLRWHRIELGREEDGGSLGKNA